MNQPCSVLLPLYNYPVNESTWAPLHDAIADHPSLHFIVIVNPNSGPYAEYPSGEPGYLSLPGKDYCREIPRLTACDNVTTIGYIRIDYCKKPLSQCLAEIETYAAWHKQPGLGLGGIFVDESPNHFSPEHSNYLAAIQHGIKAMVGLGRERLIFHNPGTPPDEGLRHTADVFVTSEEPYLRYNGPDVRKRLNEVPCDRAITARQISGVPLNKITDFTKMLRQSCSAVFVTDLEDDFYESFGDSWKTFVAALDDTPSQ